MLEEPMLDPMGAIIAEYRAVSDVAALVGTRVRGGEPAPGDAKGSGEYQAFVLIQGAPAPYSRVPVSRTEYTVRAYGVTHQGAGELWGALVMAQHQVRARLKTSGLGIYLSWYRDTADQLEDPDTHQPYVEGTLVIYATAQAIT